MSKIFNVRVGSCASRKKDRRQRRRRGAEPIQMRERRHGYFPKLFVWRGKRYRVNAVERCWTVFRRKKGGKVGLNGQKSW